MSSCCMMDASTNREMSMYYPSKYAVNGFRTTPLVLNVMWIVANRLNLNIDDDTVSNDLYDICCSLESYPADADFGSSDSFSYVQRAKKELVIEPAERKIAELLNNGLTGEANGVAAELNLDVQEIAEKYNLDSYR